MHELERHAKADFGFPKRTCRHFCPNWQAPYHQHSIHLSHNTNAAITRFNRWKDVLFSTQDFKRGFKTVKNDDSG